MLNRLSEFGPDLGELDDSELAAFAYETLGDPLSPPAANRAALARLSRGGSQQGATQPCSGRMTDRPRAALPGPLRGLVVAPGASVDLQWCPQRPMRGPYWLGITSAEHFELTDLRFGQDCAFNAPGSVPGAFFDVSKPEHLIAIAGQTLVPGMMVRATLRNRSCGQVVLGACLWGNDEASLALAERLRPVGALPPTVACPGLPMLERCTPEALNGAHCPACGQAMCGFALAERYRREREKSEAELDRVLARALAAEHAIEVLKEHALPTVVAERSRREDWQARAGADLEATLVHHRREPFELGDVWETPSDES